MNRKIYRTKKGQIIDYESYVSKHQKEIAVGNAQYNARGDTLGKGGEIVKTVSERANEYYQDNPKAVKRVSIKDSSKQSVEQGEPPIDQTKKTVKTKKAIKKKAPKEIIQPEKEADNEN